MFPSVGLYPGFDIQRGADMTFSSKKIQMIGALMVVNIIACIFLGMTWTSHSPPKIRTPTERFWQKDSASESFWNRQQQRLDFLHNPNFNSSFAPPPSSLPDWLNDTTAKSDPCLPDLRPQRQISDYNLLPRLFQDFLLFARCRSYRMSVNQPAICQRAPFLLLVVKTLVPHFERRQAIRETWGRAGVVGNRTVATVFLLGKTLAADSHPNLADLLEREAEMYGDILQWDYRDSFFNLTLKDVLFLDWFHSFCPGAQFVLKGDDDVFVNTPRIVGFLDNLPPRRAADLFAGDVITDAEPCRSKDRKYFVPESYFVGRYPPYAGGGGFLYSRQVAFRLRDASRRVAEFPIDDVYTGMCLKKLGLVPEKHSGFRTFDITAKHKDNPCIYRILMVVHSRTPQEMKTIWRWIMQPELDCQ